MSTSVTLNGTTYTIPRTGDNSWSATGGVDDYLVALATAVLQKSGGSFTLSAEVDFGASFGLKSIYLKSRAASVAAAGVVRLGNAETISWRNAGNSADLALKANSSDVLEFNGNPVVTLALGAGNTALVMNAGGTAYSWTQIVNANIASAAAIALSKLAALTTSKALVSDGSGVVSASAVSSTELGYLSGVTSAVQTQINTNATNISTNTTSLSTHTGASSGVHGVVGSVVGTSDSQTLTNKTLTGAAVSNYLQVAEQSAPSTPSSGQARLYASTDSKLKFLNSAGLTKTLGDAGSGEINVIANASDSTNWAASGAGVTLATSSTASDLPLSGVTDTSIKITPVSGTDYVRYRWTMPAALKGRKLKTEWHQRPLSGYALGDFKVDVYTNSASNYGGSYTRLSLSTDSSSVSSIPNQTGKYTTTFDATTDDYYELRIVRTAGTTALNICNVIVGPGIQAQGAVVGEWQSYTPTGGMTTNTTYTGKWRRVGDSIQVRIKVAFSGAPNATPLRPTLPSGYTVDTTKLPSTTAVVEQVGTGVAKLAGNNYVQFAVVYNDSTSFKCYYWDDSVGVQLTAEISNTAPLTVASGDEVDLFLEVPITEWSGSGTLNLAWTGNDNSSVRVDTGNGHGSTNTKIRRFSGTATTVGTAVTYADSATAGASFTINEAGVYAISYVDYRAAAACINGVSVNSVNLTTSIETLATSEKLMMSSNDTAQYSCASVTARLNAADVVRPHTDGGADGATSRVQFIISKVASNAGQPVGFSLSSPTSSGLVAPRSVQTSLTVTCGQAGYSTVRAVGIAYQDQGGSWRLKFNIDANFTSASVSTLTLTLSGVTFKTGVRQSASGYFATATTVPKVNCTAAAGTVILTLGSAATADGAAVAGDVELDSKPTWA